MDAKDSAMQSTSGYGPPDERRRNPKSKSNLYKKSADRFKRNDIMMKYGL